MSDQASTPGVLGHRASLAVTDCSVYEEVRCERTRAHALHRDTSMESYRSDSLDRLAILTEEVGEVAKEFNEARHDNRPVDLAKLRKELIQTAAMAVAWADSIRCTRCGRPASGEEFDMSTLCQRCLNGDLR